MKIKELLNKIVSEEDSAVTAYGVFENGYLLGAFLTKASAEERIIALNKDGREAYLEAFAVGAI